MTVAEHRAERLLTIGAVCGMLKSEFPDISISKIRYLEDQGLLTPRRTPGGYRLFGEDEIDRLETILRLQRAALAGEEQDLSLDELCTRAGIAAGLVRDLEGFGLLAPSVVRGDRRY